jgi:DNA primase
VEPLGITFSADEVQSMTLVQDVKSRIDIVEVVSDHVALQKAGRHLKAPCPFHAEKTPSFFVFPERQTWRCFGGCATGGDAISFVMKADNLDFPEALSRLAQRAGVTIPSRQTMGKEDVLHQVNQATMDLFGKTLHSPEGARAREYLEKRGVSQEVQEAFNLGLSPSGWDALTRHLMERGYKEEDIIASGVAIRDDRENVRDLFHRRLMFPIRDTSGQVVGFGGRTLDESGPKYLNTPRTQLFDKGKIVYGLHLAKESVKAAGVAVIVEGYMDVIAAHQHGFKNVIASMGTALTELQVSAIKAFASTLVLAMDPDNAGREATWLDLQRMKQRIGLRAGGRSDVVFLQRQPVELKVLDLPTGKDPDVLIREAPPEWERLVSEARLMTDYVFEMAHSRFDLKNDEGKRQAADFLMQFIFEENNPFAQDRYFRRLADLLEVSRSALEASVGRLQRRNPQRREGNKAPPKVSASPLLTAHSDPLEEYCLYLLLTHFELRESGPDLSQDYFDLSENRDIFTRWTECFTIENIRESLPSSLAEHLQAILEMDVPPLDKKERERSLKEVVNRLKERYFKVQEQVLMEQMEGADWLDISSLEPSASQAQEIAQRLRELFSGSSTVSP